MYNFKRIVFYLFLLLISATLPAQSPDWVDISPSSTAILMDMHWLDETRGFVVGYDSTNVLCFRTSDGGMTWANTILPANMFKVYFRDSLNGYAVGYQTLFTKTTDGCLTWSSPIPVASSMTGGPAADLQFTDSLTGYVSFYLGPVTDGFGSKTTDGGATWTLVDFPVPGSNIQSGSGAFTRKTFHFLDANRGFAGVRAGWLHFTSDGAASWDSIPVDNSFLPTVIDFVDANTGFAVGPGKTYMTTDAGLTWNDRPGASRFGESSDFVDGMTEYHVTAFPLTGFSWGSEMHKSTDGGQNFTVVTSPGVTTDLDFLSPEIGYALVLDTQWLTYETSLKKTSNGAVAVDNRLIDEAALEMFPNPTRDVLQLHLKKGRLARVIVIDLQGRELLRLNASGIAQGLRLDVAGLPAGMYLVEVETKDGKQLSRKFLKE